MEGSYEPRLERFRELGVVRGQVRLKPTHLEPTEAQSGRTLLRLPNLSCDASAQTSTPDKLEMEERKKVEEEEEEEKEEAEGVGLGEGFVDELAEAREVLGWLLEWLRVSANTLSRPYTLRVGLTDRHPK
eukprot:596071-Prorocentrum_minimum.AAC.1